MNDSKPAYAAFISYASADKAKAFEVCETLEDAGFRCWIAPRDVSPSKSFGDEIIDGIERAKCLVLILSEAANGSPYVIREVERAVSKAKPVFPFRVQDVLPSKSLELFISTTQWIDAWSGSTSDSLSRLVEALGKAQVPEPVASRTRARKRRRALVVGFSCLAAALATTITLAWPRRAAPSKTVPSAPAASSSVKQPFPHPDVHTITQSEIRPRIELIGEVGVGWFIAFDLPPRFPHLVTPYQQFKIDDGPWKPVIGNMLPFVPGFADGDLARLDKARAIHFRYYWKESSAGPETIVGPFVFPIDEDDLRAAYRLRALASPKWLSLHFQEQWGCVDLAHYFPAITTVRLGASAQELTFSRDVEQPTTLFDPVVVERHVHRFLLERSRPSLIVPEHLRNLDSIAVQLVFFDGSESEVRMHQR